MMDQRDTATRAVGLADLGREPFRIFFPAGIAAGLVGVALWPLHFGGWVETYPGQAHARLLAHGFLGGFILGFLGTAGPRLLGAAPLGTRNVGILVLLHAIMTGCWAGNWLLAGDVLFLGLLLVFLGLLVRRVWRRQDLPPPGFLLAGLGLFSGVAGAVLAVWHQCQTEPDSAWVFLERLLSYQSFVLLPILGVGPFLLPRFFGWPSRHDYPSMLHPNRPWRWQAMGAMAVGGAVLASFGIEAAGHYRLAHGLRFAVASAYPLAQQAGLHAPRAGGPFSFSVRLALTAVAAGYLAVTLFPPFRVALLHVTFMGGFALLTLVVATRVVFGHGGHAAAFQARNRWLYVTVGVLVLAMATRVSGDFWPAILISHYVYGALCWIAAVLFWGVRVLPKVLRTDPD
ncbi:MAG: NnrS family protein [Verrucomicrobiales bacterium]|nr:NnrS family protein [Verrucomicrobiales bacterium]